MASHLETVVQLSRILTELAAAQGALAGVPDWMRELHGEHAAQLAAIQELDAASTAAASERRTAEAAVADTQEQLKHYQQQMGLVTTQREYGALLKEIDTAKASIHRLEEEVLGALERHEQARASLEERRTAFAELDRSYADQLARWEQEKPAIQASIAALEASAEELRKALPRAVLAQFERLRSRLGGEPLATIKRVERPTSAGPTMHSCAACNYRVRPQVLVEIRAGEQLVQCESCKRILYLTDEG